MVGVILKPKISDPRRLVAWKRYRENHPDRIKAYSDKTKEKRRIYVLNKQEYNRQYMKKYYSIPENKEKQKLRTKNIDRVYLSNKGKEQRINIKNYILSHYSNGLLNCACCGEDIIDLLTIDHINNDGYEMRKYDKTHRHIYVWLKKNNLPKGYQVLCYGCNMGKFRNGGQKCFHKNFSPIINIQQEWGF